MDVNMSVLIALVGCTMSVTTFFVGRTTAAKNSGQEYGVMLTEIGYIKSAVDDLRKKVEQSDKRYMELAERVGRLEATVHMYHGGTAHE